MLRYLVAYLATAISFVAMDFVWLTTMTPLIYKPDLGPLMTDKPNLPAAILFYVLYLFGVVLFAVAPALAKRSLGRATALGATFGLIAYATYDLTNLATLKGFTVRLTVADLLWGAFVSGAAATVGYIAASRVKAR